MQFNRIKNDALPPVLLTSCVYISDYAVKLTDPIDRYNHTLESIQKWLEIAPGIHLIVCDNSGFDFSQAIKEKFPEANIECLFFVCDKNMVQYHGKGYGEGEIIKHAIQNSIYLKQADFFAKCTAKLWVENFNACINEWNGNLLCNANFSNVFSFRKTYFNHVDTRFYLVSKEFYLKNLSTAHLNLGVTTGIGIEDNFRDAILMNHMQGIIFNSPPVIAGVGGGTGKYYNVKLYKRIKENLRSKLVKLNTSFRHLFNFN
jgi:hypothetical protein